MNVRAIFLFLVFFCLMGVIFADSITDYKVPTSVPLNQKVFSIGQFEATDGNKAGYLCAFFLLDSSGNLVYRATDQYTTSAGRFAMNGVLLTEPLFERGRSYTLRSECGSTYADANFLVAQKQEAIDVFGFKWYPQSLGLDLNYWLNAENSYAVFMLLIIIAGVVFFGYEYYLKNLI